MGRTPQTSGEYVGQKVIVNIYGSGAYPMADPESFPPDGCLQGFRSGCVYICISSRGIRSQASCAKGRRKSRRSIHRKRIPSQNLWSRLEEFVRRFEPFAELIEMVITLIDFILRNVGLIS
jgi:hypothetical protein